MEVFELIIDEDKGLDGVQAISIVSDPAIESGFVALEKEKTILTAIDDEKRILMGAALIPNKKIFRKDKDGNPFYIFFSEKTIREASELFFKKGYQSETTMEHAVKLSDNTVVESWIKEDEVNDKSVKYGLDAPVGSWIISMKIEDDNTYNLAKSGQLTGFSIEAYFAQLANENKTKNNLKSHNIMEKVLKAIKEGFEDIKVALGKDPLITSDEIKNAPVVYLEKKKLDNGTMLEAEKFEAGEKVFIVQEDERIPLPSGNYEMEGKVLVLSEEGVIEKVEEAVSEEAETEDIQGKDTEFVSKDDFNKAIDEIKALLSKEKEEKQELQKQLDEKPDADEIKPAPVEMSEVAPSNARERIMRAIKKAS